MSSTLIVPRPPSSKFGMGCGCFRNYSEHQTCSTLIYHKKQREWGFVHTNLIYKIL